MNRKLTAISLAILLCACSKKETPLSQLPDLSAVRANLAFTCVHEGDHLPSLDAQANSLFKYARYLEKKDGPKNFNDIARYYRIAAVHGHYKANQNLQQLITQGLADSPDAPTEAVDLATQLIQAGIPAGYYDIGHYLETGYGLKQDAESALRYFRKAADLGNPEAQSYVAEKLLPKEMAPDIARQMWNCAAAQGYGDAAGNLGIDFETDKNYAEAVRAFQLGGQSGDITSVSYLSNAFKGPSPSEELYYLALPNDPERARRYHAILQFLHRNDGLNPKVPDIDNIVPLPPATLPPWDGTFQWQKEQDAAVAPSRPSDALVDQLAKERNLDPATGLPLAGSTDKTSEVDESTTVASRLPVGTIAMTGTPCPEGGVWCAKLGPEQEGDALRRFQKGDVLPSLLVRESRKVGLLDRVMGPRQQMSKVAWELVGYLDQA
ncbi:SEL1-like repeat protein [Paraburkholderia bannensis]|uniref:SEL1-like repeat protein n=1 Tax=Paraburkholderia bannensis TaxID=765414 RepID=UPI002AAFB791|nr:sel1 repeat family protein [Paraburkholderia bannensis]